MYRIIIFFTLFSTFPHSSISTFTDIVGKIYNKFWKISCEFTTLAVTSRTKRSIEIPNLHDVDELYDYLYPLIDLKPEDFVFDGRSSSRFWSSWLDDVIEHWVSECHHRNQSVIKSRQKDQEFADSLSIFESYSGNSTISMISNKTEEGQNIAPKYMNSSTVSRSSSNNLVMKNNIDNVRVNKTKIDRFFTPYGGDIEYFFPIFGFGIPFDGEITFLGFHGFKGIFPYR